MATIAGLEPATSGVTGRHSNQLNYSTFFALRFRLLAFCISAVEWRGNRFFAFAMQSYAYFFISPNFFEKNLRRDAKYTITDKI